MRLSVEIDSHSGFCGGVIRAIGRAEDFLDRDPGDGLLSLGAIVHNEAELARLSEKGLRTIGREHLARLAAGPVSKRKRSGTLLIRAHGEPPQTYSLAAEAGLDVIDCTCPVVLRLQRDIKSAYARTAPSGGRVVIFGKIGHAEVLGLLGQVGGDAVVVEDVAMLEGFLADGSLRCDAPVEVFSQTTKSPEGYSQICSLLKESVSAGVTVHETICSQVASRHRELLEWSVSHDAIVFVSGAESSNGKVLFELCRSRNPRTHHISGPEDIDASWFRDGDRVGICGATSTPGWLLDKVAESVSKL